MSDEEILAIAAQLWEENQGIDFTMERLTTATGISRATLYRRLGSREAILQRLAQAETIAAEELARPDIPTRIMQATRTALNRYGFAALTIEQIAQEAGVGPATVYRHFGSKEALLTEFVNTHSPRQMLHSLVANEQSDLTADLTMLAQRLLEFMHENRGLIRVFVYQEQGSAAYLEKLRAGHGRTLELLANYLDGHMALGNLPKLDAFALALAFVGMLLGLGMIGPTSYARPLTDFAATAHFATQMFLNGVTQIHSHPVETQR